MEAHPPGEAQNMSTGLYGPVSLIPQFPAVFTMINAGID